VTSNPVPSLDTFMDTASSDDSSHLPRYVRFGPFQIDRQRQQVYRDRSKLRLQGKVYQVLLALIQKQGEVVSREELRQALWPADTHVNYDANVNTTVNKLRQALGETTEKPAYIETIPRKGYSFIGAAEFSEQPFTETANPRPMAAPPARPVAANVPLDSRRWVTLLILGLILAGVLLGAGAAALWIARVAPQIGP